ncbi:hypothetical protein B566_EDAN016708 [Ephemera danica]|nr:hypothetical protein B566_EDAN016708 [Ephemera danica]
METCVLIPQEFSLVLTTTGVDRNANKLCEMRVNVWSNARIPQGTVIYPFQGTIRLDKLEVYSYLEDSDRLMYKLMSNTSIIFSHV